MNSEEFRENAKKTIDYICNYKDTVARRRVSPGDEIKPNFLKELISDEIPENGESFDKILDDFDKKIMPGLVHWCHPRFHAYFSNATSYPSILGDLLSGGIGPLGFSWKASPAFTELEIMSINMYAKALDLPKAFRTDDMNSIGIGSLHSSASETILVALIAARARAVKQLKGNNSYLHESIFLPHLVAYTSEEAHSSVEKAAKIAIIKLRVLKPDCRGVLRGDTLAKAIEHDVNVEGLTPVFVSATVGTTGIASFDKLSELGRVCKRYPSIWFHVDGAYGGNAFILPELRHLKEGLEYADSFNVNPNKLLLTGFDCSCLWVKNKEDLKDALVVMPEYLKHNERKDGIDLRHYGIALSRRFRALKLWFVLRSYGISGLQNYVRTHARLAKRLEALIKADDRFSVENEVHLTLVVFRLKIDGDEELSQNINVELLERINQSGQLHMVPTKTRGIYAIRFAIIYEYASENDIDTAWEIIQHFGKEVLNDFANCKLKFQQKRCCSSRYSFTRSVSREIYDQCVQQASLQDDSLPIIMPRNESD